MQPLQGTMGAAPPDGPGLAQAVESGMVLSPRRILRRASSMSAASVLSALLAFPTSMVAARWVGPEDYGRAQLVLLLYLGAVLVRSGAFEAGVREFVHHQTAGDEAEGRRLRDLGFACDVLLSLVPAVGFLLLAGSVDDRVGRVGFVLAPVAVLAATVSAYLGAIALAAQRFPAVALVNAVRAVISMAATLVAVAAFGAIGLLIGPLVADASVVGLLVWALRDSRPRAPSSLESIGQLVRIGFPIGLGTVVYWAYRLTGSTSVALTGDAARLGVYAFALAPVTVAARALAQLSGVLTPTLWSAMARDPDGQQWRRDGTRMTLVIALLAGMAANLGHAWFGPVVHAIVPSFTDAIPVFGVLVVNVFLLPLAYVPTIVLQSRLVNRQVVGLWIGLAALAVNVAANVTVLALDAGSIWIALNDLWVQAGVVAVTFAVAAPHLERHRRTRHLPSVLAGLLVWTAGVGGLLHLVTTATDSVASALTAGMVRTVLVGALWLPPACLVLRSDWVRGRGETAQVDVA